MSYAIGTTNYNLPQTQGTDKRDWSDTNAAFLAIDSAIKTAGDTASSASTAASTAQTRADNAYTLASTANTAAGNAATAAATADEKAATAKTRADSAYTLANNALPKSDVALLQDTGTVTGTRYDGMSIKGYTIVTISFNNASATAEAVLMTLPAKLRPSTTSTLATVLTSGGATSAVFVTVATNGQVTCPGALAGAFGSVTFIY